LDDLPGWKPDAVDLQLQALGKIEGVEVEATLLGGPALAVFTPHADAVAEAAFVAVSPRHPQVEALATPSELEALAKGGKKLPIVQTATQAAVPGVEALLPVVISPAVDARFGPTAALGIPARDEIDREVAERLEKRPGLPFRATRSSGKATPAARFRLADWPVSGPDASGPRVPVAHCPDCGPVAVEPDVAATTEDAQAEVACGKCGGPAQLDKEAIGSRFISMWSWLIACLPPELESRALAAPELERGVPAQLVVWGEADALRILDKRVAAKLAAALGELSWLDPPEPFRAACACGSVRHADDDTVDEVGDLDRLVGDLGADVIRLAMLSAAAPETRIGWSGSSLRHSERFLGALRDYSRPRLDRELPEEIDRSSRLRRRLAAWCGVAEAKILGSYERMEIHRACYDLMLFLRRIRDFEERCSEGGRLEPADEDALALALRRLLQLAAPCVPAIAAELELTAGGAAAAA
jgi:leucyl-tRNA synthetase